jgi:hypothetical protein
VSFLRICYSSLLTVRKKNEKQISCLISAISTVFLCLEIFKKIWISSSIGLQHAGDKLCTDEPEQEVWPDNGACGRCSLRYNIHRWAFGFSLPSQHTQVGILFSRSSARQWDMRALQSPWQHSQVGLWIQSAIKTYTGGHLIQFEVWSDNGPCGSLKFPWQHSQVGFWIQSPITIFTGGHLIQFVDWSDNVSCRRSVSVTKFTGGRFKFKQWVIRILQSPWQHSQVGILFH